MEKIKLGKKYACFKCGCKFYDLSRPQPICPKCGADQNEAPKQEPQQAGRAAGALAAARPKPRRKREEAFETETDLLMDEEPVVEGLGEDLTLIEDEELLDLGDDDFPDET